MTGDGLKGLGVTPYPTSHLKNLQERFGGNRRRGFEAFCFLIEAGRRRIGHSADLGRPEDLEPLIKQPLDLLVCELAHFTPEDLFRYLRGRAIQRIAFVHLSGRHWEKLNSLRRLAVKMLPGIDCRFAHDDEQIAV